MIAFADILPGSVMGQSVFRLTDVEASQWTALFPTDARYLPTMPRAMVAMVVMRAFMEIMHDRPKGNIHAGQTFWFSALPKLGEIMTTQLRCVEKFIKSDKRWVVFETKTMNAMATPLFRGKMNLIWAA